MTPSSDAAACAFAAFLAFPAPLADVDVDADDGDLRLDGMVCRDVR